MFVLLLRFRPGAKVQFQPGAHGHVKDGACLFCSRDIFRLSLPVLPGRPREEGRRDELGKASPLASFQVGKSRPGKRKECFEPKSLKALFLRSKAGTVSASAGKRRTGPLIAVLRAFLGRKKGRKGTVPPRTDAELRSLPTAPRAQLTGLPESRGTQSHSEKAEDFPGGPLVKTLHFHCRGHLFYPCLGN